MKIFLGDLVHDWEKTSSWTFPLNIGYMATYGAKYIDGNVEFRLFKRPEQLIEAIRAERPDVVGLSHYVWNANVNHKVYSVAKSIDRPCLTVGGGPNVTKENDNAEGARQFFEKQSYCDAYVFGQAERGFVELINTFINKNCDISQLKLSSIPGSMINSLAEKGEVFVGARLDAIRDLDDIPSPYLAGVLDEFFNEPMVPILKPIGLAPIAVPFVHGELARKNFLDSVMGAFLLKLNISLKDAKMWRVFLFGDANFGILERDALFAAKLYECHKKYNYPGHVALQWNKTRPDRVLRVIREFRGLADIGASMQSLDPMVLSAIKRKNLSLDDVAHIAEEIKKQGNETALFSELILGLPMDTFDSHVESNRVLIDLGTEVFNYNLHLLPGTEMDTQESRQTYFKRTGWRLHDNAFGIYDGTKVVEGQEVVLETSTMTMEELRSFRLIHFLLQFMWARKWYAEYLKQFVPLDVHVMDVILRIASALRIDPGEMGEVYQAFKSDHDLENFETFEELEEYWCRPENMERLRAGNYGKLNYTFTFIILLEHQEAFNSFLFNIAREIIEEHESDAGKVDAFLLRCREVLKFIEELRITFTEDCKLVPQKRRTFNMDVLAWKEAGEIEHLSEASERQGSYEYDFYLTSQQQDLLEKQLNQYRSNNLNLTLRQMSVDSQAERFFYQVRHVNNPGFTR